MRCLAVRCPELAVPAGTSRNTSDNTYLTYAHYSCNGNTRMLDGSTYRTILCDAAGLWSDVVTDCQRICRQIRERLVSVGTIGGVAVGWAGWTKSGGPQCGGPRRVPGTRITNNFSVTVGETVNRFAVGSELYKNALGGRARPPGPAGGAIALPRSPSR